ncbi:GHKL domain-containing protein [Spirosoma sp. HMF4905]|uniref:histidine kinase n=1 Tax=Spirosoma arboris TaxID=2682092 RepID=A0A7K1SNC8_9BACT|nr:HAMP domain-containing sensor histidine kinase [Spirosoma arboris]MVM35299.1 GHKL domain-containing protein [Spirosoma arboris]
MKDLSDNVIFLLHDQVALLSLLDNNLILLKELFLKDEISFFISDDESVNNLLKKRIENHIALNNNFLIKSWAKGIDNKTLKPISIFNESMSNYINKNTKLNPSFYYDKLKNLANNFEDFKGKSMTNEEHKIIIKEIDISKKIILGYFLKSSLSLIDRLKNKSNNFVDYIKNDSDSENLPFEVSSMLEQIFVDFQLKSSSKKIEIEKNYENQKFYASGSKPDIIRAFENLVNNAIKYNRTSENHKVWISVKIYEENKFIKIRIENWGVGILENEIIEDLIYKIGYRGEYARLNNIEGQGYGLSFAKKEIEKSGGLLSIESKPSKITSIVNESTNFITVVTVKLKKA